MREYTRGDVLEVWKNTNNGTFIHMSKVGSIVIFQRLAEPPSKNIYIGGQYVMPCDVRPKHWYVNTPKEGMNNPIFKRLIEMPRIGWIGDSGYYGFDGSDNYGGYRTYVHPDGFINHPICLTLEEWDAFNYDGQRDLSINEINKQITMDEFKAGDKLVVTSGVSIHGTPHGTKCRFLHSYNTNLKYRGCDTEAYITIGTPEASSTHTVRLRDLSREYEEKTKTMESNVTINRKQLLNIHHASTWQSCSTCVAITKQYLMDSAFGGDSVTIVIAQEHLDRIKELSQAQKSLVAMYITLPKEETYKMGDYILSGGSFYIIANSGQAHRVVAVNLATGNIAKQAGEVTNASKITQAELDRVLPSGGGKKVNLSIEIE